MSTVTLTREAFLGDRLGKAFSDVVNDPRQPFADVLDFFNDEGRQRRMEESEIHHDRAPFAGVVREFEADAAINQFFRQIHPRQTKRFRQSVGALVRMIMERRGWRKTGRKGSLGVRATTDPQMPKHNTGGLAFWFLRAERYELIAGMPYQTVKVQCHDLETSQVEAAQAALSD
jgi:hypothetical protein